LLRLAVKLMQKCSERKDGNDYTKLVNILGTHFQIRDDYMNLMSEKVFYSSLIIVQRAQGICRRSNRRKVFISDYTLH